MPSPSGRAKESTASEGLQRSQTIGQKIMGNMIDNLFVRSFTSKPKNTNEALVPSPPKVLTLDIFASIIVHALYFFNFIAASDSQEVKSLMV